jgi:hypothetical protein
MKRFAVLFVVIVILAQYSFSQSEFLRRGQSGFGGGVGFGINREMTALNLYAGFSYKGFLNADIAYSKADGGKVKDGVITPSITYYFIKQEDAKKTPTLGVSIGYCQYTSKTTETVAVPASSVQGKDTTLVTERKIYAVKIGVSAHHRIGSWKIFFFQPLLSSGLLLHCHGWEFTLRGGVAVGSRIKGGPLLIFTPSIEMQSGLTTFVFNIGAVF